MEMCPYCMGNGRIVGWKEVARNEKTITVVSEIETCAKCNGSGFKKLEAAQPRWISVEERLPEDEVVAANFAPGTYGYKECIIGYISKVKCTEPDWQSGKCYAENDYEILNNVTHWLPLPPGPEEE